MTYGRFTRAVIRAFAQVRSEHDEGIRGLSRALERASHEVDAVEDGTTAAWRGLDGEYTLLVLDSRKRANRTGR